LGLIRVHKPRSEYIIVEISLYTILSSPILYGVWHIKGGSGGGVIYCAKDAQ